MMSIFVNIFATASMILGVLLCSIGVYGVFKMKDVYTKQHVSGLIDTGGVFFICLSLSISSGWHLVSIKPLFLAVVMILMSAPLCYAFMQIAIRIDNILVRYKNDKKSISEINNTIINKGK